ncbi:hypothetical protein [Kordiimonas sp.]|uniref:hypothetical protein n=1 Tax=Kordiimonas sp. TaxID=1970157 RepID=UPI003A95720A
MPMHAAEFYTLTQNVGLEIKDVAMLTLVPEAKLKLWLAGDDPVPDGVAGLVCDIDREIAARLARAVSKAADREDVILIRFRNPLHFKKAGPDMAPIPPMLAYKCHCALINRLYTAFVQAGKTVSVRYWQPD